MTIHRSLLVRSALGAVGVGVLLASARIASAEEAAVPSAEPAPVATPAATVVPAVPVTEAPPESVDTAPPPAAAKPKPPPYSLPWQLRPVGPGNVLRLDTSFGFYKNPATDKSGSALATSLLGSYKIIPDLALIGRVGLVHNSPPDAPAPAPQSATSILNPVVGGLYGIKLSPSLKLGLFLGFALPVGTGGGTNPDANKMAANGVGILTRSAFDNAMFAVNYFTVFPGIDFAYVAHNLTVQVEATVLRLTKVRGPDTIDHANTNFTAGLHVGYFIIPMLSLGAELRHQRWLSTPNAVGKDATHASRDVSTFAIGPRLHFKLSETIWFRPGVSLTLPIDDPMKKAEYKVVQLDLPFSF